MNIRGQEARYQAYLAQNTAFWRENTGYPQDEHTCLYVDLAHDNPAYLLTNLWLAKYLQKLRGGRLVGLSHGWLKPCPGYSIDRIRELAQSFLVDEVIDLDALPDQTSEVAERFVQAIEGLAGAPLRNAILHFDAESDPDLGWVLYDTWIRQEHVGTIESTSAELIDCAKSVFRCRAAVSMAMQRGKAVGAVVGHYHYSPYSFIALEAARQGAPVYFQSPLISVSIRRFLTVQDVRRGRAADFLKAYLEHVERCVSEEQLARWQRRMFAVQRGTREFFRTIEGASDRKSREAFLEANGLDPQRPVVCLYAPALCAAPHCFGAIAYDDFADWLDKSLQIAVSLPGVNFLVKRHPQDAHYDRSGFISHLQKVYGTAENVRFLKDDIDPEQMTQACDLVALMSGTPGYEMAARGVPTVTAAPSRYSGLGFARETMTVPEYRTSLARAGDWILSTEERNKALLFGYFELVAGRSQSLFVPRFRLVGSPEFWTEAELSLQSKHVEEDPLFRNMTYMVDHNLPFLLNTDLVHIQNVVRPSENLPTSDLRRIHAATLQTIYELQNRAAASERKQAESTGELSRALALVATLLRNGGPVEFGLGKSGNCLLGPGWSTPEPSGIWTDGLSAEVSLPWVPGRATLNLACYGFVQESSPHRCVEIVCNGVQIGTREFCLPAELSVWTIDLSASDSKLRLLFRIPEPRSAPGDARLLGVWISRLWLTASSN